MVSSKCLPLLGCLYLVGGRTAHPPPSLPLSSHPSHFPPTHTPADYGSNLGDFMEGHDLKNLTKISSLEELHTTVATIEESFCTAER